MSLCVTFTLVWATVESAWSGVLNSVYVILVFGYPHPSCVPLPCVCLCVGEAETWVTFDDSLHYSRQMHLSVALKYGFLATKN